MAYIPSFHDNLDFLQGNRESPDNVVPLTGGGGGPAGTASGSFESNPTGPSAITPSSGPDVGNVGVSTSGSSLDRLFNPIESGAQDQRGALEGASNVFYEDAGPGRTYEGIGAQETLQGAVDTGTGIDAARDLVGARYEGPQAFNQETVADIQAGIGELQQRASALSSGHGLQSLLQRASPGLTPGEARLEAQRMIGTDDYRQRQAESRDMIREFSEQLRSQRENARKHAEMRQEQEQNIAQQSRDYLGDRRSEINAEVEAQINQRRQQQEGIENVFTEFRRSGDARGLDAVPSESLLFDPNDFYTPAQNRLEQGQARWNQLVEEYADLADHEFLPLEAHYRGQEWYGHKPTDIDNETWQRLQERQKAFEAEFSPGTQMQRGQYGDVMPMYFGEQVQLPDARAYTFFEPGVSPSRENSSTEVQRTQYNRINDILGDLDRIDAAGEPYRAAMIAADIEGYLNAEEAILEQQDAALTTEQNNWLGLIRKTRKKYKKNRKKQRWAKIAKVIGAVVMTAVGGPVGTGIVLGGNELSDDKEANMAADMAMTFMG